MTATVAASALNIPHSRIRELAEVAMSMDGVYKLYFGESNLPTPDYIKRAAEKAMADGFTFYTENAGLPSTRGALARYYQELQGVTLDPATEIVVTAGPAARQYWRQALASKPELAQGYFDNA